MRVGYRRVSSIDQNFDRQDLGVVDRLFEEKVSGRDTERSQLQEMLGFVRAGDEIVVYSIDRLARDLRDLQNIVKTLNDRGVSVSFLSERLTFSGDLDDPFSVLQLHIIGAVAMFERNIIRKRQAEGIAKAKHRGVYKGRTAKVRTERIRELIELGYSKSDIARELGICRNTVWRALQN